MSSEGQLLIHREYANLNALLALGSEIAREDERRFRESGLASQHLHVGRGEAAGVGEDRQLIAFQRLLRENIELNVREATHLFLTPPALTLFSGKAYPN